MLNSLSFGISMTLTYPSADNASAATIGSGLSSSPMPVDAPAAQSTGLDFFEEPFGLVADWIYLTNWSKLQLPHPGAIFTLWSALFDQKNSILRVPLIIISRRRTRILR